MDTKIFVINKTLHHIMWNTDAIHYAANMLHHFQTRIYRVQTSLYALRGDTESLYEYMRTLASQELNPMIIPPDILKMILHKIEDDIRANARLKLCEDPEINIWSYYGTVKLTPIVLQDYLMLILTVPLVDQSLHMNLYKVYNLPMLHPTLNVHVQYDLEGTYLATMMDGMFISLPTALDIRLCLVTNGHLCMFDQALYPIDNTEWCIYALFINDKHWIKKNCFLKILNRTTNLAYSLDGYLWAISALATEKLQIRCVMDTHVITIQPPLQIVDIGNGREAYSPSIYIPAKSELTATIQSVTRSQFFLEYNFNYTNITNFLVWYKTDFANLTNKEIESLKVIVLKLLTMSIDIFNKALENIDEKYPFSLSPKLLLALLVLIGVCFMAFGIMFIWHKRITSLTSSTIGNLVKLVPSLLEKKPTLNSLLPILSELKFPESNQNKNIVTSTAVSQLPQTTSDELISPPILVPHLQMKTIKHQTSTPSKSTNTKTEPLSLELFNCAAMDLNQKGEIELERYRKYLSNRN